MKIAFHTNAFVWAGVTDLQTIADDALEMGYDALEIGPGIPLEEEKFRRAMKRISITNFIYCRNFISDEEEEAAHEQRELFARMAFASSLGIENMVISTGISRRLSLPAASGSDPMKSMDPVVAFLERALAYAQKLHMRLLLENCPMYRNIATSPVLFEEIFRRVPDLRLGLCYDASHFVWQMIEPIQPVYDFGKRIGHIHLKDTAIDRALLSRVGILHNVGAERGMHPMQWWRHTVMGQGEIDWAKFKRALNDIGYSGSLSFEMEDYLYECDPAKVRQGLTLQREYLKREWGL